MRGDVERGDNRTGFYCNRNHAGWWDIWCLHFMAVLSDIEEMGLMDTKKIRSAKEADWYEKELLVKDLDDFLLFIVKQDWTAMMTDRCLVLNKSGRRLHFEVKEKWIRFQRNAFPLVRAFYFAKNMEGEQNEKI